MFDAMRWAAVTWGVRPVLQWGTGPHASSAAVSSGEAGSRAGVFPVYIDTLLSA